MKYLETEEYQVLIKEDGKATKSGKTFVVYTSKKNNGKEVRNKKTWRVENMKINYEGKNYFHLGGTSKGMAAKMVLKKHFIVDEC